MINNIQMDINEVVLDFSAASYKFEQHFGDTNALSKWFEKVEKVYGEDPSKEFEKVAIEALNNLAKDEQKYLISDEKEALLNLMFQLPNHSNACEKIVRLKKNGAEVVAFLDKSKKTLNLKGIDKCFI